MTANDERALFFSADPDALLLFRRAEGARADPLSPPALRCTHVNDSALALLGGTRDQWLRQPLPQVLRRLGGREEPGRYAAVLETGEPFAEDVAATDPRGHAVFYKLSASRRADVLALRGRDVTAERRRAAEQAQALSQAHREAEQALQRTRRLLEALLDNAPVPIFVVTGDGRVQMASRGMGVLLGRADSAGRLLEELFPEPLSRHFREQNASVLRARRPLNFEDRIDLSGEARYFRTCKFPIEDTEERAGLIGGVSLDITDLKLAQAERAELLGRLEQAVQFRDEFLAVASHELKTPLTTLQLQIDGLLRAIARSGGAALTPERLAHLMEGQSRQLHRLTLLINDLLDVSRIRMGKLTLHPEAFDLAELTRELVERHRPQAQLAGCPLTLVAPDPILGSWDRPRLEQVLANLLTNAFKHAPGAPVTVSARLEAPESGGAKEGGADKGDPDSGGWAELRFADQGPGSAPADLQRIFERFEQGRSYIKVGGGLGLGRYISREIVRAHGGEILVRSPPHEGATFIVRLPLSPPRGPIDR